MPGLYFLKQYTRTYKNAKGEKVVEVRCSFHTTSKWMVVSTIGAHFEDRQS